MRLVIRDTYREEAVEAAKKEVRDTLNGGRRTTLAQEMLIETAVKAAIDALEFKLA